MGMLLCVCTKEKMGKQRFLHGPFLPIYGSGAIVILISTIAVKDIVPLVLYLEWFHPPYLNSVRAVVWKSFWCTILGLQ